MGGPIAPVIGLRIINQALDHQMSVVDSYSIKFSFEFELKKAVCV